jgi:asparagine synthase (glutamine-hydrolysing)
MCGIAGFVGPSVDSEVLARMTDALMHRGPDDRSTWISPCGYIGLGHRRLAILDLSENGAQPMSTPEGDLTIVFNGEIYNFLELKRQLPDYHYQGHSDTEVILAAYRKWGRDCLKHLNGMFAFALWDVRRQELFCARDRLGVKPFFYASHSGKWFFGSEVKAILAGGLKTAPDMKVWSRYLTFGAFERSSESFFSGVFALPAGFFAIVRPDASMSLHRWWYLPDVATEQWSGSEESVAERISELLDDAVRIRLRSDVPVGLNLTGGLDSSSIAQSLLRQRLNHQTTHVFTAAFNEPRYDEDEYADMVIAGHPCQRHISRLDPEDVPSLSVSAIYSQEAPFGGIGMLAYETIHRKMKSLGLKVALEGQGGDELFAGYSYFQPEALLDLIDHHQYHSAGNFLRESGDVKKILNATRNTISGNCNFYQDGTNFLDTACINPDIVKNTDAITYSKPFGGRLSNAQFRDLTETKLVRVLRMNDRKSMAHGVELRQPFLDYRLVEFAFRLPSKMKIKNGYGKYVLRKAMSKHLPQEIVWAKKRPVVTPQREWMKTYLKEWVLDLISDRRFVERGIFDSSQVSKSFETYLNNDSIENSFSIWQWINTELWFRQFIDN